METDNNTAPATYQFSFDPGPVSRRRLLAGLFLLCVLFRLFLILNTEVIGTDGEDYLNAALRIMHGDLSWMVTTRTEPVYPLLISVLDRVVGHPVIAGYIVSVLCSAAGAIVLFSVAESLFDPEYACLGTLIYIYHPYIEDVHAGVMTEGVFFFFFICTLYFCLDFFRKGRVRSAFYAGASSLLAGFTRAEGFVLPVIVFLLLVVHLLTGRMNRRKTASTYITVSGLIVFLIAMGVVILFAFVQGSDPVQSVPYLTGKLQRFVLSAEPGLSLNALEEVVDELLKGFYYALALFFLLGWAAIRNPSSPGRWMYYLFAVANFVPAILVALVFTDGYFGLRYVMAGFALMLPIVGAGYSDLYTGRMFNRSWIRGPVGSACMVLLLLTGLALTSVEQRRSEENGIDEAGRWLKDHTNRSTQVAASTGKISFYAYPRAHVPLIKQEGFMKRKERLDKHLWRDLKQTEVLERYLFSLRADYAVIMQEDIEAHAYGYLADLFRVRNAELRATFPLHRSLPRTYVFRLRDRVDDAVEPAFSADAGNGLVNLYRFRDDFPVFETFVQVEWSRYLEKDLGSYPALGEVDGDGRSELLVGLYPGGNGWLDIRDDGAGGFQHRSWGKAGWDQYNEDNGSVYPAAADLNADGTDEIVTGYGTSGNGWIGIWSTDGSKIDRIKWIKTFPGMSKRSSVQTRVSGRDLDADPAEELIVTMNRRSGPAVSVRDDRNRKFGRLDRMKLDSHLDYENTRSFLPVKQYGAQVDKHLFAAVVTDGNTMTRLEFGVEDHTIELRRKQRREVPEDLNRDVEEVQPLLMRTSGTGSERNKELFLVFKPDPERVFVWSGAGTIRPLSEVYSRNR